MEAEGARAMNGIAGAVVERHRVTCGEYEGGGIPWSSAEARRVPFLKLSEPLLKDFCEVVRRLRLAMVASDGQEADGHTMQRAIKFRRRRMAAVDLLRFFFAGFGFAAGIEASTRRAP